MLPAHGFIPWCRRSALGHVALFEVIGLAPLAALYIAVQYQDGGLTLSWALYIVFLTACALASSALLTWFLISKRRWRA